MATVITGTYEQFNDSTFDSVFYMDPADGRTDTFDLYGFMPGGAVFVCRLPELPVRFHTDFPKATKVDMINVT